MTEDQLKKYQELDKQQRELERKINHKLGGIIGALLLIITLFLCICFSSHN